MDIPPKPGDYVTVFTTEDGEVAILQVTTVGHQHGQRPALWLDDGSMWDSETGLPLDGRWKGHRIEVATEGHARNRIARLMERVLAWDAPMATLAKVYAALLKLSREPR